MSPYRRRALLIAIPALVVGLLVLAQLILPGIAAHRVRDDLKDNGDVTSVKVHAFPAVKLLFGKADKVTIRMRSATVGTGRIAELLDKTDDVDKLDVSTQSLAIGPLKLRDASVSKDGGTLHATATVRDSDLRDALPVDLGVKPVSSDDGSLVLEATAGAFGVSATVRARLSATGGKLIIAPDANIPFVGGLLTLTLFDDPRVLVTGVGARAVNGGFVVAADGRLP